MLDALCIVGAGLIVTIVAGVAQEATPVSAPRADAPRAGAVQPGGALPGNSTIQLVKIADGLADPVAVAAPLDGTGRIFVVERVGHIRIIDNDGNLLPEPFLDLTSTFRGAGVDAHYVLQGMLGLAFHPDYVTNGRFYVAYTDVQTNGDLLVVEFQVSADEPNRASDLADGSLWGGGGRVLLDVDQPFVDHNGGALHFGPDGYLYIALGDGGGDVDPFDRAQDRFSLLGKLLRIDVDGGLQGKGRRAERVLPYGIPPDNPFAGGGPHSSLPEPASEPGRVAVLPGGEPYGPPVRQEIWASGLREPWQFSFDPETGDLYITDVGALTWEEINFQPAGSPGGQNYGWNWMEGAHCFPEDRADCPRLGVPPVAEYKHGRDGCAIVGIGVYRGDEFPSLDGIYFSADYCSGKVWGLQRGKDGAWIYQELLDTELLVYGAGTDEAGNLYVTSGGDNQGSVWQLVAANRVPEGAEAAPLQPEEGATPTTDEVTPSGVTPTASPAAAGGDIVTVEEEY